MDAFQFAVQLRDVALVMVVTVARVLPCLTLLPAFSLRLMSGILRIGIACIVAAFVFPVVSQEPLVKIWHSLPPIMTFLLLAKEALLGMFLGALLSIPFWVITAVGEVFDSSRGALSGQQLNPELGMDSSVTDDLLRKLAIFLWMEMGGLCWLLVIIGNSYQIWPMSAWWPQTQEVAWESYLSYIKTAFITLMHFSAPLLIVLILTETMLAIMSVHTPRLQPYYLAMPVKAILGMTILALYQPYLQDVIQTWFYRWYASGWLQL
jgi:type III secretion protein T